MTDWKKLASTYKAQHEEDTGKIAKLSVALIKARAKGCTCQTLPGDEYYCSVHGGEGSLVDLKVKTDLLIEALGEWIVTQDETVKESAAEAFGRQLKTLGQTLQNHYLTNRRD